jgi:hypothetical protein
MRVIDCPIWSQNLPSCPLFSIDLCRLFNTGIRELVCHCVSTSRYGRDNFRTCLCTHYTMQSKAALRVLARGGDRKCGVMSRYKQRMCRIGCFSPPQSSRVHPFSSTCATNLSLHQTHVLRGQAVVALELLHHMSKDNTICSLYALIPLAN